MTLHLTLATLIAAAHYLFRHWESGVTLYPDGVRYLHAGAGNRLHRPFHLRWLLPWLLRDDRTAWRSTTAAATIALAPVTYLFLIACGVTADRAFIGAILAPSLPGIFRFNVASPFTVDAPALLLSIIAATLFRTDHIAAAVVVTCVAASVKESSPAFVAAFAWHPLALVGFAPVIIRQLASPASDDDIFDERSRDMLRRPFHWGRELHRAVWFDWTRMLAPWGVAALGFAAMDVPWVAAAVALGYAQTLVATDTVRLYQWAAPAMLFGAVGVMPEGWGLALVAVAWLNPYSKHFL